MLPSADIESGCLATCPQCRGEWVSRQKLDWLVRAESIKAHGNCRANIVGTAAPRSIVVNYRVCPTCGERMNRRLFAAGSGVVIDECCGHGVWLDDGERGEILLHSRRMGTLGDPAPRNVAANGLPHTLLLMPVQSLNRESDSRSLWSDVVDIVDFVDFIEGAGHVVVFVFRLFD
jgi:Zn-finger nucleic acid-binding protein